MREEVHGKSLSGAVAGSGRRFVAGDRSPVRGVFALRARRAMCGPAAGPGCIVAWTVDGVLRTLGVSKCADCRQTFQRTRVRFAEPVGGDKTDFSRLMIHRPCF